MSIVDRIKCDGGTDFLVWKYPSDVIRLGAQLIVNESQMSFFYKNGMLLDKFGPGRHTLISSNLPVLHKLVSLPFGGETPFTAEVWFINLLEKRDIKWGTSQPIPLMDLTIGFPISLRAFGSWGIKVVNPQTLLLKIIGTKQASNHQIIADYFSSFVLQSVTTHLSAYFREKENSFLKINSDLRSITSQTLSDLRQEFDKYGIEVVNFNIDNVSIPESEKTQIQEVFLKTMEAHQLSAANISDTYKAIKTFDILGKAAGNDGGAFAALAGAGMGLGAGLNLGREAGNAIAGSMSPQDKTIMKLKKLKELLDLGILTQDEFDSAKLSLLKDL